MASALLAVLDQLRTLVTVIILVFGIGYPCQQILMLLMISVFRQSYLAWNSPYAETSIKLALFNEFLVSLYLYFLLLITDYNESDAIRDIASFGLLSVTGTYTALNLSVFFYKILRRLYFKVRAKCVGKKATPEQLKLEETAVGMLPIKEEAGV